jgi:hypothetical protein
MVKLRTFLLASTLLTGAGIARAEPVRLDPAGLDAVRAAGLRQLAGSTESQASAFAAGPVAVATTRANHSAQSDGRTARLVATTSSRAAVALFPR